MSAETVGSKLKLLRKEKRLTQDELAALIDVKRATISNYEIDRRQPSLSDLSRFAEFFGVGLDFFGLAWISSGWPHRTRLSILPPVQRCYFPTRQFLLKKRKGYLKILCGFTWILTEVEP